MFLVVLLAGVGGNLILNRNLWHIGIISLLISFGLEYFLLTRLDTRIYLKETREEIKELIDKADEIKNDLEDTEEKLREMNEKVFGHHYSIFSFKSIKEDIEEIKKEIGKSPHSYFSRGTTINERMKEVEKDLAIIKKSLGRQF